MPTMRDFLLSKTTLPVTETYSYKQHLQSFVSSVTAEKGGEIVISSSPSSIEVVPATVEVSIDHRRHPIELVVPVRDVVIEDTDKKQVVIDLDC